MLKVTYEDKIHLGHWTGVLPIIESLACKLPAGRPKCVTSSTDHTDGTAYQTGLARTFKFMCLPILLSILHLSGSGLRKQTT
ncbi:hypothetical protein BABINDRAFT_162790 [Babjeviella inositovora NRRL Y-12698]|uniref:Uncharacterized protein n=1 Tax=Babjeviella inositovora NRRL Y-12698 TaxID=984486 RepID=A0A1E3QLL0_9ASCO|nr:uncharacterized protein BABINDRAFT_162790 [Babjeviella inositovora NRRL Y-12698]ODQ78586.1 hypothetical protein BABINDRAFT_162790 [Babjeviella inositovora NRRL Y-12698]